MRLDEAKLELPPSGVIWVKHDTAFLQSPIKGQLQCFTAAHLGRLRAADVVEVGDCPLIESQIFIAHSQPVRPREAASQIQTEPLGPKLLVGGQQLGFVRQGQMGKGLRIQFRWRPRNQRLACQIDELLRLGDQRQGSPLRRSAVV